MAKASTYKPFGKSKIARPPDEIRRCVDENGKYILVKKYLFMGRQSNRTEVESCSLDYPAEWLRDSSMGAVVPNVNYDIQLINYHLDNQQCNEYELRNLIMVYLKKKRKTVDNDKFRSACAIFDKADKMLSRCDRRKNSNKYEADVSYNFLIKSYKNIVKMCEAVVNKADKADNFKYSYRRGFGFDDATIELMEDIVLIIKDGALYNLDPVARSTRIYDYVTNNVYEVDTRTFRNYINQFYKEMIL